MNVYLTCLGRWFSLLERNSREKFEGGIDEESIFGCTKLATLGAIKW